MDDDLVGVVSVALVADVVEPAAVGTIACQDPVALGSGEQATEFRLPEGCTNSVPLRDLPDLQRDRISVPHRPS